MITKRDAMREVVRLKKNFGWTREDVNEYAQVIVDDARSDRRDLHRAVTTALGFPEGPRIPELMGLMHATRRDAASMRADDLPGVEEGEYVDSNDCHNCGGPVEFRAPFLWCPECKAVQQVGRDMQGRRNYALDAATQRDLTKGPDHEWPETPEEAKARIKENVAKLLPSMDMNAALAEPSPADVVEELQDA